MKKRKALFSFALIALLVFGLKNPCFAAQSEDPNISLNEGEKNFTPIFLESPSSLRENQSYSTEENDGQTRGVLRGAKSTSSLDAASNALYQAVKEWKTSVILSSYQVPVDQFQLLFDRTYHENGDLFHWDVLSGLSGSADANGNIYSVSITYKSEFDAADQESFYATCEGILADMSAEMTDVQKCLYLHDYLITHCEYDMTLVNADAYDALITGSAVCEGYTLAYEYLCKQAGIPAYFVSAVNPKDSKDRHSWNVILLDGEYYYVDCTWDDPTGDYEAYCSHANFLRSRDGINSTGHDKYGTIWSSDTWGNAYASIPAATTYDNCYWSNVITAMPFIGTTCAYAHSDDGDHVYLRTGDTETAIPLSQSTGWPVWDMPGYYYTEYFMSMTKAGENFYFSTEDSIYRLTTSGTIKKIYELTNDEKASGRLYGIVSEGSILAYVIAKEPFTNSFVRKLLDLPSEFFLFAKFGHTCNFQNRIELNYKITADLSEYDDFWLAIERQSFKGAGEEYYWETAEIRDWYPDPDDGRYVFVFNDIAAAEMGEVIKAKLCAKKDEVIYESGVDEYSLKEYAINRIRKSADSKFRKLMVDMLNYGAAAQVYFEKNTNNLVNAGLTEDERKQGTQSEVTPVVIESVTDNVAETARIVSKSVAFKSGVELNAHVNYDAEPAEDEKVWVELTYVATSGDSKRQVVTRDKFVRSVKDGVVRYSAAFDIIATPDFGKEVTLKVFRTVEADGVSTDIQISETYTYSLETYAANRLENSKDENFKALLREMLKYERSAVDFFVNPKE